ncbi:MAG: K(+)-transporting ATPase subunit F [Gemmataceae bacterium]|nr:K(+)-transporting ATPase subunit F [Gemmataceae bacterium]
MDWTLALAAALAAGLGVYLGVALLKPEWFS